MRDRSNRMDACLNDSKSESNKSNYRQSVAKRIVNGTELIWIIVIGAALLLSAGPAFGQFTVQPMKLELAITPGKIIKSDLRIQSFDPDETHTINMSITELSQMDNGEWAIIEPNDITDPNSPHFGFDLSKLSSCKDWISLSHNVFELAPNGVVPIEVSVRVERGVRGFYGAGILATSSPMQGVGDVSIVVRFYVPVILEVQDRPARTNVESTDVGLELLERTTPAGEYQAVSLATMNVENNGGSYSRIKPIVRIWSFTQGHWRIITTTDFEEKGIIPGVKFKVSAPIRKPLPSGKYKVAGYLYVDGRRRKKVEKEIDYVGDKRVSGVAADAPLDLDPADVTIDGLPGAIRTATLTVYNASKEAVNVRTAMGLPSLLQHSAQGDVKGEDLDCSEWVKVTPEQFTLRGDGGMQNLRIVATMPGELSAAYPSYFTLLALWTTYPDGKDAGVTTTNICLRNSKINAEPAAAAIKVIPQTLDESKYIVVARFGNVGQIGFVPIRVKAGLVMPNGIHRTSTFLSGDPSLMLPFEQRDFSGVLDLTHVPADIYRLAAAIEYAPGVWESIQIAVRVSIEGERRILEVLGMQEEISELIEVKW
ncbi:MAG: hypothetical protein JW837_03665 [Sedimentisphaerales bacterium]|nr:hypothetical protein [Sedimentisphaerales bacterium]